MNKYLKALIECKKIDEEKAIVEGIFSSANEDRHGDFVMQNFDLKTFKKNPVILDSHDHYQADSVIGKAIPKTLKIVKNKLVGKIEFAVNENPKAQVIFDLIKGGFINAFSIGFIPKEFDDKGKIIKSELLEISVVSVPANSDALVLAKKKGIDIDKLYVKQNIKNEEDNGETSEDEDDDSEEEPKEGEQTPEGDGGDENIEGDEDKVNENEEEASDLEKSMFGMVAKEYENWDETNEEIRFKVKDIAEFEFGTFKRITLSESMPKIYATVGKLANSDTEAIQMLFFPKAEGWTQDDARKWFSQRQFAVVGKPAVEDSISTGKSAKQKIKEALAGENKAQLVRLNKIYKAISLISEVKVETRSEDVRAEKNRLINKSLSKLLKIKKD